MNFGYIRVVYLKRIEHTCTEFAGSNWKNHEVSEDSQLVKFKYS
jgi:hypothetical protein